MANTIIKSNNAPAPIGPYSQAVVAGNTIYCSGQVSIDPTTGKLNNPDLQTETTQVMQNLNAVLTEAGFEFKDVVKCSIFLKDMNDFAEVNQIYGQYFTESPPARETVQVAGLPLDVNVEISLIAVRNS
jgi:2-iminobutanoate/2-iminopropanoate deaminase